jgi:hypothetical protein
MGANFRSELEAADGKKSETESKTSDVAVNTGMTPFFLSSIQILSLTITKNLKNHSIFKLSFSW